MKKVLLFLFTVLAFSITFISCCDVKTFIGEFPYFNGYYWVPNQANGAGQFAIGGYVNGQLKALSRAAVSSTYDDKFSLFAWTKDSTVMNNFHGVFNENTWGYSEQVKFFDNFVDEYNFIAIIPQSDNHLYSDGKVTVEANTFTVETNNMSYNDDQEVLYAVTTVQKANYSSGASLSFNHANSKVYLKFTSDDANTEIIDYTPYNPGSPEVPATPGTVTTKSGKAIDMLYAGEVVYWPYAGDANLTSTQANNFYKNTTNYGNMGSLMEAVNAQFVYYNTSGTVTTNPWVEGNKKDMYGLQLASTTDKDDFVGGTTEDTWKDAFWTNASTQIKDIFRKSYSEGWRVIRIDNIAGTQYDAWLLNNTEMTYKVITGGTPYQPAVPATGKEGIIILPATSVLGDGTDAVLSTYPSTANIEVSLNGLSWTSTATKNTVTFSKPNAKLSTTEVTSPTTWFTFPKVANSVENLGYTIKFSYIYKGVEVYDARVYIPADKCNWESGKYYTYVINIKGRGNGHDTPNNEDADDPVINNVSSYEIIVNNFDITDYTEGQKWTFNIE